MPTTSENAAPTNPPERRSVRWSADYYVSVTTGQVAGTPEAAALLDKMKQLDRLQRRRARINNRHRGTPKGIAWDQEAAERAGEPLGKVCQHVFLGGGLTLHVPAFLYGDLMPLTVIHDDEVDVALLRGVLAEPLGVFPWPGANPYRVIFDRLQAPLVRRRQG